MRLCRLALPAAAGSVVFGAAFVGAGTVAAGVGTPSLGRALAEQSDPVTPPPFTEQDIQAQDEALAVAGQVESFLHDDPSYIVKGINVKRKSIQVYWHAKAKDKRDRVFGKARAAAAAAGYQLDVIYRRASKESLDNAVKQAFGVVARLDSAFRVGYVRAMSVDFDGLTVTGEWADGTVSIRSREAALVASLESRFAVPVRVKHGGRPMLAGGR